MGTYGQIRIYDEHGNQSSVVRSHDGDALGVEVITFTKGWKNNVNNDDPAPSAGSPEEFAQAFTRQGGQNLYGQIGKSFATRANGRCVDVRFEAGEVREIIVFDTMWPHMAVWHQADNPALGRAYEAYRVQFPSCVIEPTDPNDAPRSWQGLPGMAN